MRSMFFPLWILVTWELFLHLCLGRPVHFDTNPSLETWIISKLYGWQRRICWNGSLWALHLVSSPFPLNPGDAGPLSQYTRCGLGRKMHSNSDELADRAPGQTERGVCSGKSKALWKQCDFGSQSWLISRRKHRTKLWAILRRLSLSPAKATTRLKAGGLKGFVSALYPTGKIPAYIATQKEARHVVELYDWLVQKKRLEKKKVANLSCRYTLHMGLRNAV